MLTPIKADARSLLTTSLISPMSEPDILLAFKAGRAFRRETSNSVDPSSTKGAILLVNGEDGLLHFQWKNRETGQLEEVSLLIRLTDS